MVKDQTEVRGLPALCLIDCVLTTNRKQLFRIRSSSVAGSCNAAR